VESEHLPRDRLDSLCAGQGGALPPFVFVAWCVIRATDIMFTSESASN